MPQDENAETSIMKNRWLQLVVGIIGMVTTANLPYGWTLFVGPIDNQFRWGKAAIQVVFTLFVLAETWLVPLEAFRRSLRAALIVGIGGILLAIA